MLSRLEGDISELQRFGIDSLFALFSALLGLIGAVVIMLFYDLSLAIFALILFPLEFFLLKPMYSKMHNITKDVRQSSSIMGSFIIESLRYVSFLKKFNAVKDRKEVLISLQKENKNKILLQQKLQIVFTQIPLLISLTARVVLIFLGGLKVINGEITIGQLISFLSYFSMVLAPVHTVLGILNNIPKLKVSINRLDEILPQNRSLAIIDKLPKSIDIEFKNVNFSYNNSYDIFRNLNLKIAFKDKIVLTGPNGIGKTTLIELLLNEHLLNKGEILLNGINIEEIKNETLQNHIALVEQNPVILSTTVKENLLIANKNADEDELLNVLEKVGLLFWFKSLERGFQTVLSEDGQNLSGGQKQRLAIARVILKKPSIVIMDEPTSSLDKDFIKVMDGLIDENFKESTKIIISHHFCYKNAKYLKIKDKKIVELKDE
ncbi:ABC transporter ATP-binding protein [Halarcobacter anaerophilus]|uniref:ABC transporter ATP-binding protein n=1 Tax=Halarcobacter anaerophilus TaxID=877500 RepID=UPI000A0568F8|nr:ABC transporter ATP-binding protein [Halarcobacter anaerophilus]